jgi:hypothetical protein
MKLEVEKYYVNNSGAKIFIIEKVENIFFGYNFSTKEIGEYNENGVNKKGIHINSEYKEPVTYKITQYLVQNNSTKDVFVAPNVSEWCDSFTVLSNKITTFTEGEFDEEPTFIPVDVPF